jgi:predicted MPP superfamily phosphohydrolase
MNKLRFKLKLLAFSVYIFFSGSVLAQKDTLSFLHITDMHTMFNLENYDPEIVKHREYTRGYKNANSYFKQFMQTIPGKTNSDMVVATGDLIDFFDAKTPSGKTLEYQVEQFARLLDGYQFPIFLTLGNHDIFSYNWGNDKVIPDQLQTGRARATWIRNFDCFRNGTYYSQVHEIGETTYRLIFIDNGFYQFRKDENMVNPYIDKPQLHWLRAELNESDEDIEIILMHIPFTKTSALPESANELYAELVQNPSVKLIFAGHFHKGEVMRFPAGADNEMVQAGTDALVNSPENWRLVRLTENNILVSVTGKTENELIISVK